MNTDGTALVPVPGFDPGGHCCNNPNGSACICPPGCTCNCQWCGCAGGK